MLRGGRPYWLGISQSLGTTCTHVWPWSKRIRSPAEFLKMKASVSVARLHVASWRRPSRKIVAAPVPVRRMSCACEPAASTICGTSHISVGGVAEMEAARGWFLIALPTHRGLTDVVCRLAYARAL